jgi:hypothetical protein
MAFGLTGAPGTFQAAMNSTLAPYLRKFALVFFDDILIYRKSLEENLVHIRLVFELLVKDQWKIKLSKCSFVQREISYLGHVISEKGVATDPKKIEAIAQWPTPQNVKELRSFLGLAGYYRKFVRHFGLLVKPLTDLLKKHSVFVWTSIHQNSFQSLQTTLCNSPVLSLPDFSKTFSIETDASGSGVGAVLLQDNHPLAFLSKALGPKSRGLSAYEKEYMAILLAVQQWRQYLQHGEFHIYTDQRSLCQLNEQRLHTQWQQKVFTKLLGLQYKIIYKQGTDNRVADALPRKSSHVSQCANISVITPKWIEEVVAGCAHDEATQAIIAKLSVDPIAVANFVLSKGLLRFKDRVWIRENPALHLKLLQACHTSALGGHSGIPVTYMRMKKLFAWKGLRKSVQDFVQSCLICQQAKPDRTKLPGLLQPLPVPSGAWQIISLDFVEGLPKLGNADCILMVVDSFTKYGHFLPLKHPFTSFSVAKAFLDCVYKLHGPPSVIISDRDKVFTSNLWQELFKLAGVALHMSSAYHPQSDGQTECLNQTMETYLRCFVNACPSRWLQWLPLAEFWYNTSVHSATGVAPFIALYGYEPKHFGLSALDTIQSSDLHSWMEEKQVMTDLIQQHLQRAKQRMKKQADKHRSERQFNMGDLVLVKLQPYIQSSLARRSNQKLSFKYFGPFPVIQRIGQVAYKLQLPEYFAIHPVFHVSQLKPTKLGCDKVSATLPSDIESHSVPELVLQQRVGSTATRQIRQVLIKWSNWPPEMATWENLEDIRRRFPAAPAWGQAGFQGGETVTTLSKDHTPEEGNGPVRRSNRPSKPSTRMMGPEWVVG